MSGSGHSRGSEWRKWDLQVQPVTQSELNKLEASKTSIKARTLSMLQKLETAGVEVVAITDHNCGYAVDLALELDTSIKVLPGVEIETAEGWHALIIFNETYKEELGCHTWHDTIKSFLNSVCGIDGALFKDNGEAAQAGRTTLEIIKSINSRDRGVFIFSHSDASKGFFRRGNRETRRVILDSGERIGFDTKNEPSSIEAKIKALQGDVDYPIIRTSDAHTVNELGGFSWIKADPTYEGLKQILYEPNERVRIQEGNPDDDVSKYILTDVDVGNNSLVVAQGVPINRGLVSVIGGRGSGKSFLLDAISSTAPGYKKHESIEDGVGVEAKFRFQDKDGNAREVATDLSDDDPILGNDEPVFYIHQTQLAGDSKNRNKVRSLYLQEIGISSDEVRYGDLSDQIGVYLNRLDNYNQEYLNILGELEIDQSRYSAQDYIERELRRSEGDLSKVSKEETKDIISRVRDAIKLGKKLRDLSEDTDRSEILNKAAEFNELVDLYNARLERAGIDTKQSKLDVYISVEDLQKQHELTQKAVAESLKLRTEEYRELGGELKDKLGTTEDVPSLLSRIGNISEDIEKYQKIRARLSVIQKETKKAEQGLSGLFLGSDTGESNDLISIIDAQMDTISDRYDGFCDARRDSELFKVLFAKVTVEATVLFDHKSLIRNLEECFYKNYKPDIKNLIFGEDKPTYDRYIEWVGHSFWDTFHGENWEKKLLNEYSKRDGLGGKDRLLEVVFRNWSDYIDVTTKIEHDFGGIKKDIDHMSVGELATVLLKLKLVTEGVDKDIIMLDQPEDHLDNTFIHEELVGMLKVLKRQRQVIVATHNANVVVGPDSDQVIVAKGLNQKYHSGSIESTDIQKDIVDILEGGQEAFDKRRSRYSR